MKPPARPEPAQSIPIRPIIINRPIIEPTYHEGYRERIVEHPGGNTEPLPVFVPPPMEQTQPPVMHVHVAQPARPSVERTIYEPARSPGTDPQKERNEPEPETRPHPKTPDPVRRSPVDSQHVPLLPTPAAVDEPNKKRSPDLVAPSGSSQVPEGENNRKKKPPKSEEKASDEAPTSGRKIRKYNGKGGRIHTEAQIDELLDFYLMTGELPIYVSDRQRYDYRHHERLPEREELLVTRGVSINKGVSGPSRHPQNIVQLPGPADQRKNGTS